MNHAANTSPGSGFEVPLLGRLGLSALGLAAATATLLVLYFAFDATLFQLVLVYWCECLWIGIFSAIKLIAASIFGSPYRSNWATVSRGGAVLLSLIVIGMTSTAFFSTLGLLLMAILTANEWLPLGVPGDRAINHVSLILGASFLLAAGHGLSFVANFLVLGEVRRARVGALVALPFKRCLALLAAIVVAFAAVAALPPLATTTGFAAALILAKLVMDLRLHIGERVAFEDSA